MNGVTTVVIPARDFEASVTFYRDVIGLGVATRSPYLCLFKAGAVNLAVHPAEDEGGDFAPTGHGIYLDIFVDDLGAAIDALGRARVPLRRQWKEGDSRFVLVVDPDGNRLELCGTASA